MATSILICDDSSFARKQMARALPVWWDVDVTYCNNGQEGLDSLRQKKCDILFLDLTMPVMDGFQVLEAIICEKIETKVIVVSGDIQPQSYRRVMEMGAVAFIKKPINKSDLMDVLDRMGISGENAESAESVPRQQTEQLDVKAGISEIANIATGRAVDLLSRFLGVFIIMPVPNVNEIEVGELHMMLQSINQQGSVSAVCQGFIGPGIAGEALLIFNDANIREIAQLMKYDGQINDSIKIELLMDISGIFIGACLKSLSEQLDINLSQSHPIVLGQQLRVDNLLYRDDVKMRKTLAIEMGYKIDKNNINCELLLLFTEESLRKMAELVDFF